jgi:signal transduction histidine kinase
MKAKEDTLIEFSSYIAHEFRNSIGAIIGLARLVEKGKKPAADIVVECRLMENLIKRLLEYAQPLKAILAPVQIDQLINEAIGRAKIPARIEVKLKLSDDLPELLGDHDLLSVALSNLLQNSVKAIARKGFVEIESGKEDDSAFISIRDNGQGMDEPTINKIFKPFYSETENGMGLGLAYVNKVIEIHNGKITVESKKGVGSTFTLRFSIKK